MDTLSGIFNVAANVGTWIGYASAVAVPVIGGYLAWFKGPRQLKPENDVARVVTARQWPNVFKKSKIVAKDGARMYLNWGASSPSDIPLGTFRVDVTRKGKDSALTLEDKVKAEVNAEFFVRVDASSPETMIRALESLGGNIDERKISEYCTPKFDAALRAAAAKMQIEQVQTEREQFRTMVKEALDSLKDDGLVLIDVALRQLNQSPLEDFDPNNFFDAQGLKKVTSIIEESKQIINDTKQAAATAIQERNKQEEVRRLTIVEQQKEATLAQAERVSKMEAEQAQRVAEIKAKTQEDSQRAEITSQLAVEQARIAKDQQIAVSEEGKQKAVSVARTEREKEVRSAEIDKSIALHGKAQEEAAAQRSANEAMAEAVEAEEGVLTARQVAEANRARQIEVIAAEGDAQKVAAAERIAAEARVAVAEMGKREASEQAEAVLIEARAAKEAAQLAAEGSYADLFQKAKAVADGKMADAEAQKALNEAINNLSDEAKRHLVEMARIQMTPEAIREAMKAVEKIDGISITSMDGVAGAFGGAAGGGAGNGGGAANPMDQLVSALMTVRMAEPLLEKVIKNVGGDAGIARNLPGASVVTDAPAMVALSQVVAPEQGNDPLPAAPKKGRGPQPQ